MAIKKSLPLPNIDLGGRVQIIDDSTNPPRWKTLARIFATDKNARAVLKAHGLTGGWLRDDFGDQHYVTV